MKCLVCKGACCEIFSIEFYSPNKDVQNWINLHAILDSNNRHTFECRCTKLTSNGLCSIWEDRPLICELYIAGSKECLDVVKTRRTKEDYQRIRDENDPEFL